jgi:cytochrome oxidase Cu insertion factor (SCO1/SenC/PrrC family)
MNNSISPNPPSKPNRRPLFVVLSLFAAPLLLAFAIYYGSGWRPTGTTNKGDLITPAIPLPQVMLNKADGTQTDATFLRNSWTLVYIGAGKCDEVCRSTLVVMRNARLLLGKDIKRVERVFLYTGTCCDESYFVAEQQGLMAASIDNTDGQTLQKQFPAINGINAIDGKRTYIVDPLGNLMMSYAPGTNPRDIYQDLKKLLNLSHIG